MKIGIQSFRGTGHYGRGVGVYGAELLNALRKRDDVEIVEFSSVDELDNLHVDLVHFLVFDLFQKTLPNHFNIPSVITIHDVTPLVFAKNYPAGFKGKVNLFFQKQKLKKIDKVITVSQCSKKDITKYLGVTTRKIEVIHSGVGTHFKKISDKNLLNQVKNKYSLPERYAFYSGNVNWNKNIVGMTQSCIDANLDLVIVGKSFEQKENLDHPELKSYKEFLTQFSDHPKVHILGFVSDEDMVAILNQSSVAMFVSFYEGFGFPILEAQACGVPVFTSNLSSMPEVGGKGAMYVDPYDVEMMTYRLQILLQDEKLRNDLIREGTENVKKFNWQKCAEETVAVYKELMK